MVGVGVYVIRHSLFVGLFRRVRRQDASGI